MGYVENTLSKSVDKTSFVSLVNKNAKHQQDLLQSDDGVCRTIPAGTHGSTPHLTKTVTSINPLRIRKLTPKECWRLQGFDDSAHDKAEKAGVSESQRYKQAGNSVTVNVIVALLSQLGIGNIKWNDMTAKKREQLAQARKDEK